MNEYVWKSAWGHGVKVNVTICSSLISSENVGYRKKHTKYINNAQKLLTRVKFSNQHTDRQVGRERTVQDITCINDYLGKEELGLIKPHVSYSKVMPKV